MPQARRGKGYTHWNPDNPNAPKYMFTGVPRLVDTRRRAAGIINRWNSYPNLSYKLSYDGDDYDLAIKDDKRKKEDLEIVEVELKERKNGH